MSNFDFVTDSKLSKGVYDSNNKSDTDNINGWKPLWVDLGDYSPSSTFGAQLYTKDGVYKVAFCGTQPNLTDWWQNIKYGLFMESREFEDTVVFMASAIKQIANDQKVSIEVAAKLFSTTGHSQGGFEAELSAVLFGLKGTSLDGMGATGVVAQYRAEFTKIMQREGVGALAVDHVLGKEDFGTRIYTTVGYLGVHEGQTDGAWSWSLAKIIGALNPAMASAVLTGGLLAHRISDIVSNEELRAANPTWRVIGDAGDLNTPERLANDLAGHWGSVQVAWVDGGLGALPDTAVANGLIKEFLQTRVGESIQYWQDNTNKTLRIELSNGDSLLMYQDGRVLKTNTSGVAVVQTLYAKNGDVSMRSSMQLDDDGNALVTRSGAGFATSYVVNASGQLVSGNDKTYDVQNNLVAESTYHRNDDNSVTTLRYNGKHELVSTTTQTFDDGTQIEIKIENGRSYVRSLVPQENGTGVDASDWRDLTTNQALNQQAYQNLIYSDMAGFISALRSGDKLNQSLYGAKMAMDVMLSQGQTVEQGLAGLRTGMDAVSGAVGVVASLHALRSGDTLTQLGGATGLLSSSNQLVAAMNGGAIGSKQLVDNGFMSGAELAALRTVCQAIACCTTHRRNRNQRACPCRASRNYQTLGAQHTWPAKQYQPN